MEMDKEFQGMEDAQMNKYLVFSIGEENYGMQIRNVIEIIGIQQITKVPELPDYVKGIINLRGKVISIMDARIRFKKEERDYDDRTCIIVIDIDGNSFGLIVDSVSEVARVEEKDIAPPPMIINKDDTVEAFIEGVAKVENEIWLIIDGMRLLNHSMLS